MGCATTDYTNYVYGSDTGIQGLADGSVERKTIARNNQRLLANYYSDSTNASSDEHTCLALSGGGGRSAAFSMGTMKALSDAEQLSVWLDELKVFVQLCRQHDQLVIGHPVRQPKLVSDRR